MKKMRILVTLVTMIALLLTTNSGTIMAAANSSFDYARAKTSLKNRTVAVNKTTLSSAIEEANANKALVTVSTNGSDILSTSQWVTSTVMRKYTRSISSAQVVLYNSRATQWAVDNAVGAVTSATSVFNNAKAYGKKTVVKVDKSVLTDATSAAQANASSVCVSTDGYDYLTTELYVTPATMTAYTNAIALAQAVIDNCAATQGTVDDAVTALASATSAFNNAKAYGKKEIVKVDKLALTDAISAAQANASSVGVSTDGNDFLTNELYVTPATMNDFTTAIAQAQSVLDNSDSTQINVDNAITALASATSAFNNAKAYGKKTASIKPLFRSDSFDGSLASFWKDETPRYSYSKQYAASPVVDGNQSLRMELRKTDALVNGSTRCELAVSREKPNEEHWYDISMYLPSDYIADNMPECIIQWHNYPDFDLGESWTSSPLYLYTRNGHYYLSRLWDDSPVSTNNSMYAKGYAETVDLGAYETEQWVNWSFHVKWGWLPEHNTVLEVFKDGELVVERNGLPNTTNDKEGVYNKIGIYKWGWASGGASSCDSRVIYYDNYIVR